MIFNKQGTVNKRQNFFFGENLIDITDQYTYLGFTFVPSGKKHRGIEILLNKAWKSWFAVQKMLNKSKLKTVKTYMKLVDTIVKPVALYSCEAWGDYKNKNNLKMKIEKLQVSICKQVLGVNKTTNNMKVLAELGRTPLRINIETQMFKYLQRFPFLKESSLLIAAFKEELKIASENFSWLNNINIKVK